MGRRKFPFTLARLAPVAGLIALALGCAPSRPAADSKVYSMGERVQVGSLFYTVTETEWLEQLGQGAIARRPQHRFLAIRVRVSNSGPATSGIPGLSLVDSQGQSYPEITDAQGLAEWLGSLRMLKPTETEHGRVLFDVPIGSYRLKLADDADPDQQKTALVEIPYQLPAAVPQPEPGRFPAK